MRTGGQDRHALQRVGGPLGSAVAPEGRVLRRLGGLAFTESVDRPCGNLEREGGPCTLNHKGRRGRD
jgi:hypothetical protein